jgi:hypothetical protein
VIQRIKDWLRERRIMQASNSALFWFRNGERTLARMCAEEVRREIAARSPQQVARMERARGLIQ